MDEPGVGGGVLGVIRERGYPAHGFVGSGRAQNPRRYFNRRAEAYWRVREGLERGRIALPPSEMLAEELLGVDYALSAGERVQIEGKKEVASSLGRSPDRADAVSMCFALNPPSDDTGSAIQWLGEGPGTDPFEAPDPRQVRDPDRECGWWPV